MSICEKCNGTGIVLPGKFKTWWLSFFYGYDKDYIAYRYQKQCDCKEKDTNKLIFPEKVMVAVGPMIFCPKCSDEEFKDVITAEMGTFTKQPLCYWVDPQNLKYTTWLKKYQGEFEDGVVH
jgi:peroxiredoxin